MASDIERKKQGKNFLGILNDLKRRPEDAAKELNVCVDLINLIIYTYIMIVRPYMAI